MIKSRTRTLTKFGAMAALALGLGIASQSAATASPTSVGSTGPGAIVAAAAITVTPSTNLADGARVNVSGTGLKAGSVYHVGECAVVAANTYACNDATDVNVTASASGTAATPLTVRSSFTGTTSTGSVHAINCKTVSCVVAVFNDTFDGGAKALSFK